MGQRNTTTRRSGMPKLPLKRVHIELTNACNFRCEFCPNHVMRRDKGAMAAELFAAIVAEIAETGLSRHVLFHQQGEPTLHPRLDEAVRLASQLGLSTSLVTNGSMLTDRLVDALLDAGLSELVISLHTPDEASFRLRGAHGFSYSVFEERVGRAARRVLAAPVATKVTIALLTRALLGITAPIWGRDFALVASNRELRELLSGWLSRALGRDEQVRSAKGPFARMTVNRRGEIEVAPRLSFEVRPVAEWPLPTHATGGRWFPAQFGRCPVQGLTDHLAILWNGQYSYCCDDHDGQTSELRFQDTSLLDFLDSAAVQAAIDGFARRRPVQPYCRMCLGGSTRGLAFIRGLGAAASFPLSTEHCCAGDATPDDGP